MGLVHRLVQVRHSCPPRFSIVKVFQGMSPWGALPQPLRDNRFVDLGCTVGRSAVGDNALPKRVTSGIPFRLSAPATMRQGMNSFPAVQGVRDLVTKILVSLCDPPLD